MAADISLVNLDEGTDDPRQARVQLLEVARRANAFTFIFGNGVSNQAAELVAANAAGKPLLIIGVVYVGTLTAITVPLVDSMGQLFTTTSAVVIDNGLFVRPEWWGMAKGNIRLAVNSLPARGGTVKFADREYLACYDTATNDMFDARGGTPGLDYMVKQNVRWEGTRLPSYSADNSRMENGTIIKGMVRISSECSGFSIDLMGFDGGEDTVASYYPLGDCEGFCFLQCNKASPAYATNVRIGRIMGLCRGLESNAHAVLIEGIDGGTIEYAEGRMANHGVVVKCSNMVIGTLVGSLNWSEDVFLKSDSYARCGGLTIDKIIGQGPAEGDTAYGLLIQAATQTIGTLSIAQVQVQRKGYGVGVLTAGPYLAADINIGSILSQSCPTGYRLFGYGITRTRVEQILVNNCTYGINVEPTTTERSNSVGHLAVNVCSGNAINLAGTLSLGSSAYNGVAGQCVYYVTDTARLFMSGAYSIETSASFWLQQPALYGTWTNVGTNDPFKVDMRGGEVVIGGLVAPNGASGIIAQLLPPLRPAKALRWICLAYNGTVWAGVEVVLAPDGLLTCSNPTAASSYLSLKGVSWAIPF